MSGEEISVDTGHLTEYATRNSTLAGDLTGAADKHLGGLSVSPTMFGDLGDETGITTR